MLVDFEVILVQPPYERPAWAKKQGSKGWRIAPTPLGARSYMSTRVINCIMGGSTPPPRLNVKSLPAAVQNNQLLSPSYEPTAQN